MCVSVEWQELLKPSQAATAVLWNAHQAETAQHSTALSIPEANLVLSFSQWTEMCLQINEAT